METWALVIVNLILRPKVSWTWSLFGTLKVYEIYGGSNRVGLGGFSWLEIPSLKLIYPLKIGRALEGKDRIPTIHFQGLWLLVLGRVYFWKFRSLSFELEVPYQLSPLGSCCVSCVSFRLNVDGGHVGQPV